MRQKFKQEVIETKTQKKVKKSAGDTLKDMEEKLRQIQDEGEFEEPEVLKELEEFEEPIGARAATGIDGLDGIIEGGLRRRTVNLVAGGPGSGKTIFGMQYLVNGITKFEEPGIYITFEQDRQKLNRTFSLMGWDLEQFEKDRKLLIMHLNPEQLNKLLDAGGGTLRDAVEGMGVRRIVIDSMSDFIMMYQGDLAKRSAVVKLFDMFNKMHVTTVICSEQETDPLKHISSILEYQVDGVVLLYNERIGHIRQRALEIFKMRGTKHAGRIFPMSITSDGIRINSGK